MWKPRTIAVVISAVCLLLAGGCANRNVGTALGVIGGGVLASELGNGNIVATITGAALGGVLGNSLSGKSQPEYRQAYRQPRSEYRKPQLEYDQGYRRPKGYRQPQAYRQSQRFVEPRFRERRADDWECRENYRRDERWGNGSNYGYHDRIVERNWRGGYRVRWDHVLNGAINSARSRVDNRLSKDCNRQYRVSAGMLPVR